jgi:quercetin dioxygenase-like cupin family protein
LEVIRLVLPTGKSMPPHKVSGELTIQCLEGRLDVTVAGVSSVLQAGELMFLLGDAAHSVTALEDASALLTIVLNTRV